MHSIAYSVVSVKCLYLNLFVLEEGLGHKCFSAEKPRDPDSARQPVSLESRDTNISHMFVLEEGLEPSSLAALVPKTSAYTNSATPAN